jgi:undecaprenyl-diphosphatase
MPFLKPLILALALAAAGRAEPAPQPFLQSTGKAIVAYGASPLHWDRDDMKWLLSSALATGVLLSRDVELHDQWAKGPARRPWLDDSMPLVSTLGEGWVELPAVAALAWLGDERLARTSRVALQGLAVSAAYTVALKTAAWSNRPSQDDAGHRFWAFDQASQGMPSGHSFSAFCLAEIYGAEYSRWATYPFALLMGYSRIYNHAHWPSDVFVGAVLGIASGVQLTRSATRDGYPAFQLSMAGTEQTPLLVANITY